MATSLSREINLQRSIQLDASLEGWICEHYESKRGQLINGSFIDSGVPVGYPDLTIYLGNGIVAFVECKIHPNVPSSEQLRFIDRMTTLGYQAKVIYNMDEWTNFKNQLTDIYF